MAPATGQPFRFLIARRALDPAEGGSHRRRVRVGVSESRVAGEGIQGRVPVQEMARDSMVYRHHTISTEYRQQTISNNNDKASRWTIHARKQKAGEVVSSDSSP